MFKPTEGKITVKDGKVTLLENITESHSAATPDELWHTLELLSKAGWRLTGDYELTIEKKDAAEANSARERSF